MESDATDKPVPREITALLSNERLILRETQRAVTPFGGIAVFISFLEKIGFVKALRQHMPILWRSPNHMIASQFGTLAEQAIREKKSHIGYLEALLLAEIEERERNTIERRIREAHLPRLKTLEEFDYTQSPNVTAAKMRDLAEGG
jgi:hypothetical protein